MPISSLLRQIQRTYYDDGRDDKDFADDEHRLKQAQTRLASHTKELARAAENLNRAALSVGFPTKVRH